MILLLAHFSIAAPLDQPPTSGDKADERLEEIVVTVEKRAENVMNIPASVYAVSPSLLSEKNIHSLIDLDNEVPGLRAVQETWQINLQIRGIGNTFLGFGGESGVAFHEDGVYVSRQSAENTAFMDVERVEVLNGPQGTLYGRNATGGVVNVINNQPTSTFAAGADVNLGNYDLVEHEGYISGPVVGDVLEARVAYHVADRSGYGTNFYNGESVNNLHERGFRLTFKLLPTDHLTYLWSSEYYRAADASGGPNLVSTRSVAGTSMLPFPFTAPLQNVNTVTLPGIYVGGQAATGQNVDDNTQPHRDVHIFGTTGTLAWDPNDSLKFKAITGYRRFTHDFTWDFDLTSAPVSTLNDKEGDWQLSQEVNADWMVRSDIDIIAGLYYFREHQDGTNNVINQYFPLCNLTGACESATQFNWDPFTTHFVLQGYINTTAYAGYLHSAFDITDSLKATLGARYSIEKKSTSNLEFFEVVPGCNSGKPEPPLNAGCDIVGAHTFNSFTPQGSLEYQFSNQLTSYLSVGRGFKAGTYGFGNPGSIVNATTVPTIAQAIVVPSEEVTAYEVGMHGRFLDNRMTVSGAAFYYDYSNFQTTRLVETNVLAEAIDKASIKGLEGAIRIRPVPQYEISAQFELLNSDIKKYTAEPSAVGKHLQNIPNYSYGVDVKRIFELSAGTVSPLISYRRTGETYYDSLNNPETGQTPYGFLDASVIFDARNPGWKVTLWVKNIANTLAYSYKEVQAVPFGYPLWGGPFPPRTYGLRVGYTF
jgi:iron complex outermembrane receptor protein